MMKAQQQMFRVLTLSACIGAALSAIHFPGVPFPFSSVEKHSVMAIGHAIVGKGTTLKPNAEALASKMIGGFQLLTRTSYPGTPGALIDINGRPVNVFGSNYTKGTEVESSANPDYVTLLPRKGDPYKVDMFAHFESPLPATVYHIELLVTDDGLRVLDYAPVDWSAWGGVWTPCAGSVTPWGTHLGSEEYEPDARAFYESSAIATRVRDYARYWGLYQGEFNSTSAFLKEVRAKMNPYHYGWVTEMHYNETAGAPVVAKWYSLGRVAVEMGLVMPDNRTVYITDDGRNVGFFMFKADTPGDLSKGTLYAAKFNQTSDANGGSFKVSWVELGATDQKALAAALPNTTFASIFDTANATGGACPTGYRAVKHSYGEECLRLVKGAEMLAAAFETRRYAAYLGATTEWSKWEGITFDSRRNVLYTAMTELDQGCLAEPDRFGGLDHVRLPANKCGCVYMLPVDGNCTATSMSALTCGTSDEGLTPGLVVNNTCHINRISNPDNVAYSEMLDMLLIAEDTDHHENNFMWTYDLRSGDMTRVMSAPVGAEITGTGFFTLPNGHTYIISSLQHPYGSDETEPLAKAPEATGLGGYIGYFGPFDVHFGQELGLQSVPPPTDPATKHGLVSSSKAVIGQYVDAKYDVLQRSGVKYGNNTFGLQYDNEMKPIKKYNLPSFTVNNTASISDAQDFASLTAVCGKTFLTTQFEWQNPASMYVSELSQAANGSLDAVSTHPVDFSAWGGLWTPCAGSMTPWGTRFGSEEYEPDARLVESATSLEQIGGGANASVFTYEGGNALSMVRNVGLYYGSMTLEQYKAAFRPYLYGFITEVKVQYDGSPVAQKHYLLGRLATELALVMPDRRTVYTTDDGTNVGFFKFVADMAGDLTAGSLFAYKATQVNKTGGGAFRMDWVWMAHGTQEELLAAASRLHFSDIFDAAAPAGPDAAANGTSPCPEGFRPVNQGGKGCECLRLKPGMETYATFFETRRYAAYLGATTEWSKWEGITYDAKRHRLYTAMSDVRYGMEDFKSRGKDSTSYDYCSGNHVALEYNRCGCVYQLHLDGAYNAYWMDTLVCGTPYTDLSAPGAVAGNNCHPDRIASPDNVAYAPEHDLLLIGEDTSEHQNDAVWAYDIDTAALTRILTTPYGAETTAAYWYPNINGHAYITTSVQHPYGESDQDKVGEPGSFGEWGAVGVFGPFPSATAAALPTEDCASEMAWVVRVQVDYGRSGPNAEDVARLDAYLLARVDALLVALSSSDQAVRVSSACFGEEEGEPGVVAVVAHVQFDLEYKWLADSFYSMAMDTDGELYSTLAATFSRLDGYAISGFAVTAKAPARLTKAAAYTPPAARLST